MDKIFYELEEIKEDGTIILAKKNIDETKYDVRFEDNKLILKPKPQPQQPTHIQIEKLEDFDKKNIVDFRNSKILSCWINEKRPSGNKYFSILKDIYGIIGKGKTITKNTLLNFETIEKNDKGFEYLKNIGISVQHKEAGYIFEEILNQCIDTGIKLQMEIKFASVKNIKYTVNK
jgi:hypothetical protein